MFPIFLTAAAAGIIWLAVLLRHVGVYGGCLMLLVLGSCFGYDFFNVKLGPLPLTTDRALLGLLVAMFGLQRFAQVIPGKRFDKCDWLFLGFLLTMTANTLLHDWRWRDFQPLASLLFLYLFPACVFWLMRGNAVQERHLRCLFGFLAIFGVYLGFTAICEVCELYAIVFPRFIVTTKFTQWVGRARGPFLNPTTNGMYLTMALVGCAMCWPRAQRWGRAVLVAALSIILLGIIATLTRSCWLGAIAGSVIIGLIVVPREIRIPSMLMGAVAGLLFFSVGSENWLSFKRDKDVSQYHMAQSAKLRPVLAAVAWRVFHDYPVFGCGYGQYKRVDVHYLRDPSSELPLEQAKHYVQHNLFLGILVDTGLVGLTLYLAALFGWSLRGWQLWRNFQLPLEERQLGLLVMAVIVQWSINGMFHDVALAPHANLMLFLLAGMSQGIWVTRNLPAKVAPHFEQPLSSPNQALA